MARRKLASVQGRYSDLLSEAERDWFVVEETEFPELSSVIF